MTDGPAPVHRPRVAMVVNNGMANDSRVIKSAVSLARAGADVTAFGVASAGAAGAETTSGGAHFVRLPTFPRRGVTASYAAYAVRRRRGRLGPAERWRTSLAATTAYARAFVPALREHAPDVVHVHDVHVLGAVLEAWPDPATRPAVVYDAHEYVADLAVSGARTRRVVDGWAALEAEVIPHVDRVITVADGIARRLEAEHPLRAPVAVVHNAPLAWDHLRASRDLRAEAGVGADTALAVYSGAVSAARGLDTVIDALPSAPGVHLAVVAVPHPHPMAPELERRAREAGVADRLHLVPPVASAEVPSYLSAADVAVSPIHGDSASYDMALPNKLFEFIHAGLPIATSDIAAMAGFVREHGLGAVFRQRDAIDCACALVEVLERVRVGEGPDPGVLARLRHEFSWQTQERHLVEVYRDLPSGATAGLEVPDRPWHLEELQLDFGGA
ncbi:glycosyltransferase involved in cell wall biosynthesis [Knoellia remsis]|uniref:Glycosyltransferase involved in cell wall biosynthesis n=1 Tax=Knoellia remsis TaxID=407159 RepID=A0A2T0UDA4_9MICO|nr:glycosyltransferase family 4 protein [Knoellia remsis]PRY55872.1 glycosyltransferase involved in cell wall biosynthesis [Knoellia remsis]